MAKHPKITVATGSYQVHHRYLVTIAKERGYFDEEGLTEVDIVATNHDPNNLLRALVDGSVHFGLDARPQDVLRWIIQQKADLYLIGGYKNHLNMDIVGAKGLKSVEDLRGKRIGIVKAKAGISLDEFQARIVLERANIDPDKDVTMVGGMEMHPLLGDPIGALKRGEVDTAFVWDTETAKLEAEGYPALVKFSEFYPGGYPDRAMLSTGTMIKQHPATVTAYMKGMIRAHRFYRDMPRNFEYMVDLDKRLRAVDVTPEERTGDIGMTPEKLAKDPFPIDGRLPVEGLEIILAQEKKAGNIPESFTLDNMAKLEFTEQANRELDAREDLKEELQRVKQVVAKYGF